MTRAPARPGGGEGASYRGSSPPPLRPPVWQHRVFVERPAELAALAQELASAHTLAIDAEFVQPRVRAPGAPAHRLSLLQLAFDNAYHASYVVDALRLADLSPLEAALENASILKLFHGISADARVLAARDLYPQHLLDLEAVSRSIFGQRESGLQAMLLRASGVRLDKSFQRADWGRRPLTPAMIAYAARDAEMTFVLYDWLKRAFPDVVTLHELPAHPPAPQVAEWMLPALESTRMRSVEQHLLDAGMLHDTASQARDLAQALQTVAYPSQRVRILRLIGDLELSSLAAEVRPYLGSRLAEERAGAARALGRLRDWQSQATLQTLLHEDAVQDVRQAAETALELLKKGVHRGTTLSPRRDRSPKDGPGEPRTWVVQGETGSADPPDASDWRAALLERFAASDDDAQPISAETTADDAPGDEESSEESAEDV